MINDKYLIEKCDNDISAIHNALMLKQLSGTSSIDDEYEKKLAEFFKSSYAVAVSSGTTALHCALVAANVSEGDEVIIPPTAPIMTAMPILLMKAHIIFGDTNKDNFGFNLDDVLTKITSRTKAIITVPMWGYPIDTKALNKLCKEKGIVHIEDAAQAHGAMVDMDFTGTISDMGCFSTHDRKILPTGEGGFILTNNIEYYEKIKEFKQFGNMTGDSFGLNYKLSALQSAIGISRINQIEFQIELRTKNATKIKESILTNLLKEIYVPPNSRPNYYSLILRYECGYEFVEKATDEMYKNGIPSDIVRYSYRPMYEYPLFKKYSCRCDNADHLIKSIFTVCVHPGLSQSEVEEIIKAFKYYDFSR